MGDAPERPSAALPHAGSADSLLAIAPGAQQPAAACESGGGAASRPDPKATGAAFASVLVSAVSASMLPAVLLCAAPDIHVSAEQLAMTVSVQFAGFFLAVGIGGVLSDRVGKKRVLQCGCVLTALGAGAWMAAGTMLHACLAAAVLGMGGGILENMASALLADLYPHSRARVLNLSQMAFCAGAIAGPAIVAALLPLEVSWRAFFAAEVVLGAALLGLYSWATIHPSPEAARVSVGSTLRLAGDRGVILLALALFFYVLAESGIVLYVNLCLQRQHHAPEQWAVLGISLVWGTMLVGRMLCAAAPKRISAGRLAAVLCVLAASALLVQALATNWIASFALFGLAGLLLSGIWPLIVALGAGNHPSRTGTVMGIVIAGGSLGAVAAPALVSGLLQAGAAAYVFPVLAAALLLAAANVGGVRLRPAAEERQ
jgi:fucose permease